MTYRIFPLFSLVIPLLAVPGCAANKPAVPEPVTPAVEVTEVRIQAVHPPVELFGTLAHGAKVEIFPATEARIESLEVDEGDRVVAGQILARLDSRRIEISLDQARALLTSKLALEALAREQLADGRRAVEAQIVMIEKASRELEQRTAEYRAVADLLERRQRLFEIGGVAETELESLRTGYLRARTEKEQASSDLLLRTIGYRDQDILAAGFDLPESDAERTRLLLELNTSTLRARLDVAAADRSTAEAELRRIEMALDETTIRSPINGVVAARSLDIGGHARPQSSIFVILDTSRIYVQTNVREQLLWRIDPGSSAAVHIDGENGRTLRGRVHSVAPYIDPGSRNARVRIVLDSSDNGVVPGMFARIEVQPNSAQAAAVVPQSALLRNQAHQDHVYLVHDGRVSATPVTVLEIANGQAAVSGDLRAGELVVVGGAHALHDGSAVVVLERGP